MAGRGPAPKALGARRRRNAPGRGEWVDVGPLERTVLPALPGDHEWTERTKRAWKAWRKDPVTALYGPADIQLVVDLAYLYDQWCREGTTSLAVEIRHWQDGLGLTLKGKQDRRWRVVDAEPARAELSEVVELRRISRADRAVIFEPARVVVDRPSTRPEVSELTDPTQGPSR